jgi:hypothetical protein
MLSNYAPAFRRQQYAFPWKVVRQKRSNRTVGRGVYYTVRIKST